MIKHLLKRATGRDQLIAIREQLDEAKILAAKALINQMKAHGVYENLRETEFKVFSQFGDDGIIQYLVENIPVAFEQQSFVEFGVENYTESNTRFLLLNNNWRGLVIDGSEAQVSYIKSDPIYWKHDLTAVQSFITTDNINRIISEHNFAGEIGLLSIDIDGNDYWVWKAIDAVSPFVVIVEYNSVFGYEHAITIPYDPAFNRTQAHPSNLFWGCSLKALVMLAERKGYAFVGSNSAGNNAYFVRKDKLGKVKPASLEDGYVYSRFRESRDEQGRLTYLSGTQRLTAIEEMVVYHLERDAPVKIKDL
ncbi:MAG: hypothetical protein WCB68_23185 [Pyrinomonadaceae bacterium]